MPSHRHMGVPEDAYRQIMKIRLLQNRIDPSHENPLIAGFDAFDFSHNPHPEWREFQIFEHIVASGVHRTADVLGAVSSRFHAKGLLDGNNVRQWIEANPGYEVYVTNPLPQMSYCNFSSNDRSPIIHGDPEVLHRFQAVLDKAGVALDFLTSARQHNGNYGLCSYWFGTPIFWERFLSELVEPVIHLSRNELGSELHDFLYRPMQYYGDARHRPGALPFLLERATSLYITRAFPQSSAFYPRTRQQVLDCCLYPFERDLITLFGDQVDAWDAAAHYEPAARAYFDRACRHANHGWLLYGALHRIGFDHGNPRPHLPWFTQGSTHAETAKMEVHDFAA
ncbi:MAG: hypothetical protein U1C47_18420 [Hydrogenophaga sp.]|nr:hypothetical protein [Hydrogenophaga sp.]